MPQPKKTGSSSSPRTRTTRKPAAAASSKAKAKPTSKPKPKAKATAKPRAKATPRPAPKPESADPIAALRGKLMSSLTLTTERLQETVDEAVRRGRMTRKDAEDLLAQLVLAGRQQTEALLSDVEQLLGRGRATELRSRASDGGDAVLRTVDRARRRVGVGSFPIINYDELTAAQISKRLATLTPAELRKVRDHERRHDARKSVLAAVERRLK